MKVAFISPHADDICLSLMGLVSHMVASKHLVTVFSDSEWTEPTWTMPAEHSVTAVRRGEDVAYCARWAFSYHEIGLPDSSVRHEGKGNLRRRSGQERALLAVAEERLCALVSEYGFEVLIGPLGLGSHTDHLVTSVATRNAARTTGAAAFYYEDLPYASEMALGRIRRRARRLAPFAVPVTCYTGLSLEDKAAAIDIYASQHRDVHVASVFGHSSRLAAGRDGGTSISGHTAVVERLWTQSDGPSLISLCDSSIEMYAESKPRFSLRMAVPGPRRL